MHWLIENTEAQFILCGSSARKLKTQSTNLLGGRAWLYHFFLLTSQEIPKFNLLRAFEHFILMELVAYINKSRKHYDITYWRSKSGLEVDFIIGQAQVAIEVKISTEVQKKDIKGMIAFCEEHPEAKAFIVSQDIRPRRLAYNDNIIIRVIPWRDFLIALWSGKIVNQQ